MNKSKPKIRRKCKVLAIGPELVQEWIQTDNILMAVVRRGYPEDARLVAAGMNHTSGNLELTFWSDEFEELEEGQSAPYLDLEIVG